MHVNGRWRRLGLSLSGVVVLLLVAVGWSPVSYALLRNLETRYSPRPSTADMQHYTGMVVLGGAGAERREAAIELMRQHPDMQVLFTGRGAEVLLPGNYKLAQPAARVLYASTSTNTYEDAIDSAALPGVDVAQPWLLITSAMHMPRAVATFRKAGWNVTPYPVDYTTGRRIPWTQYSLAEGVIRWQQVLHEWTGLAVYAVTGRAAVF
jgi:uncharacterized SAM-binding protein YcdF (DUF218 family)